MYDRLLDAGGSLLYLGGNGIYQVVTFSADRSALTVRPRGEDTAREFSMFRTGSRPERKLLGVATPTGREGRATYQHCCHCQQCFDVRRPPRPACR